jgi:hypothetical protein
LFPTNSFFVDNNLSEKVSLVKDFPSTSAENGLTEKLYLDKPEAHKHLGEATPW